jgi:predicted ABC-type sugar transport system permease subunit
VNARRGAKDLIGATRRWGLVAAFFLFCTFLALATPSGTFLSGRNLVFVLLQISVNTILAAGMTMVILSKGIDLSVGSVVALSGVVGADLVAQGWPVPLAAAVAIGLGALVGLVNGASIVYLRVAPFIATLAMMTAARGLAYLYTDGVSVGNLPKSFTVWGNGRIGPVPIPVLIAAVVVGGTAILLGRTVFGRRLYALGGNEEAARLAGVRVGRAKILIYTFMGAVDRHCRGRGRRHQSRRWTGGRLGHRARGLDHRRAGQRPRADGRVDVLADGRQGDGHSRCGRTRPREALRCSRECWPRWSWCCASRRQKPTIWS